MQPAWVRAANHQRNRLQSTRSMADSALLCPRQLAANAIAAMASPSARTWQRRAGRVELVRLGQFRLNGLASDVLSAVTVKFDLCGTFQTILWHPMDKSNKHKFVFDSDTFIAQA